MQVFGQIKMACLAALAALLTPIAPHAAVMTFDFELPEWTLSTSEQLFGTNAAISISVDNGNTSNLNQVWNLASDMVSFSVTANGGTYSNTWLSSDLGVSVGGDYLSTDAVGFATLDFQPVDSSTIRYENDTGSFSFQRPNYLSLVYLQTDGGVALYDGAPFAVGQTVVPLPAAAWLFGSALLGLGLVKRRKAF